MSAPVKFRSNKRICAFKLADDGHRSQPSQPITGFIVEWHHWIFVFFISSGQLCLCVK
jgi:hypothetical protein